MARKFVSSTMTGLQKFTDFPDKDIVCWTLMVMGIMK